MRWTKRLLRKCLKQVENIDVMMRGRVWTLVFLLANTWIGVTMSRQGHDEFPVDPELENIFMPLIEAMTHLDKYGYLHLDPAKSDSNLDINATKEALTNYQKFNRLPVSSIVDRISLEHMGKARCGCMDPVDLMDDDWKPQDLAYTTGAGKWNKTHLTYRVSRIPASLEKRLVKRLIRKAFKLWSEVSSLDFTEVKRNRDTSVDITIQFNRGFHDGPYNFFGPLNEVAHAFPPMPTEDGYAYLAGHIHLDADDDWRIQGADGNTSFNLLPVILHEIGHALGLGHSASGESIMTPIIQEYVGDKNNIHLSQADINGIRFLYGPRLPAEIRQSESCVSVHPPYDAIANLFGEIYVFKGERYWRLRSPGEDILSSSESESELTKSKWKGLPSTIDAVYQSTKSWNIIFIKGSRFWEYAAVENHPLLPGYPKPLRTLQLPGNLDAAVHTGDVTYFIKRRMVWKMIEDTTRAGTTLPQISEYTKWKHFPGQIDAAFYYDHKIYLVKDDQYHYIQNNSNKVRSPKGASFSADFLGCHP